MIRFVCFGILVLFALSLIVRFNLCQFHFYLKLGTFLYVFLVENINEIKSFFRMHLHDLMMVIWHTQQ